MRVWDIDPGFLNDKSLLGEHREIHAVHTILTQGKKGYARHPETLRWKSHLNALAARHDMVVSEMALRRFNHQSPLPAITLPITWPADMIDPSHRQFELLKDKYQDKPRGRIPLPENNHALWACHEISCMARDPVLYQQLAKDVAQNLISFEALAKVLTRTLRRPPQAEGLNRALRHMNEYLADRPEPTCNAPHIGSEITDVRRSAVDHNIIELLRSTAIGELGFWCSHTQIKGESHGKII